MKRILTLLLVPAAAASAQKIVAPHGPKTHQPAPTSAAISIGDIMTREYIIADDSMEGRDTGKRGGLKSATYIAGELKKLGLEPAGDNGSYFQAIPWITRTPDSMATLSVGGTVVPKSDYLLIPKLGYALALGGQPFGGSFKGTDVPTVYGGRIGDSTISPEAAAGKVVVFAPPAERASFNFWQRDDLRRFSRARAILVATLDLNAPAAYRATRETYWDTIPVPGAPGTMTVISIRNPVLEQIFGKPAAALTRGSTGAAVSGNVSFIDKPAAFPAYNVVAIVRGSDPALRNTYVAVGAHHDHVGMGPPLDHDSVRAFNAIARPRGADDPPPRNVTDSQWTIIHHLVDSLHAANGRRVDSIFNGADDDGSGTVLALEIAEAFAKAKTKPARSVLFVFHTAEEKGLYGSQYYADHPTVPRDSIVVQVNMDQMARGGPEDNPPGGENALVVIGLKRRADALDDISQLVNKRYGFRFDYQFDRDGDPTNAYCRSDHYMYARYGIPVAFFVAAAWYIDYHMIGDEPQYVDYPRMTKIGNYVHDVVGELASLKTRLQLTGPRPDPHGLCRT
jgi:hypothetical protein